ncbi:hypothetical protein [Picosynechococcus sp. PCC 73109]|uniref:hypothetical protein n=1 Tax=Picosynechococcus sp. PCC 73109 TaxID=374982 RepID=UPI0007458525|nr:hypothetical protein [Picosynechococcus sp. PCC 73109]AMA07911.1 hypothetical protein AWQ23_00460 [Picosynechococcus sp. PCC 73109]
MARFVKHKVTVSGVLPAEPYDFFFLAPEGSYTGLATETGVDATLTDAEVNMPTCKVEELVKSGKVKRKYLRVRTPGGRTRYIKILHSDQKDTFDADIIGKTVQGREVEAVVTRQSASFA